MRKVLLLSHIPERDDVVDTLITLGLSKSSMAWKLPVLDDQRNRTLLIKPDIVIVPEIRCEYTRDYVRCLHGWGVTVVQRRCEMGITAESGAPDSVFQCVFSNWPYHEYIDLDIVWGPKFADMVVEHGTPREKVVAVGGLGFDPYFLPPPPIQKKTDKKQLLVATGFGYADHNAIYVLPEAKTGDPLNYQLVQADRQGRANVIALLQQIVAELSDEWDVLIRPHPGETRGPYSAVKGAVVLGPEVAIASLYRCDAILHTGSTMGYEAHLLGKPGLNFRNTSLDNFVGGVHPTWHENDDIIAELRTLDITKTNADKAVCSALEEGYWGTVDGNANKRATAAILDLPTKPTPKYPMEWPKDRPQYLTPGVLLTCYTWSCSACGHSYNTEGNRDMVKCPYCGIANVKIGYSSAKEA